MSRSIYPQHTWTSWMRDGKGIFNVNLHWRTISPPRYYYGNTCEDWSKVNTQLERLFETLLVQRPIKGCFANMYGKSLTSPTSKDDTMGIHCQLQLCGQTSHIICRNVWIREGMDNHSRGYVDATCVVILDTRIIRRHVGMRDANVAWIRVTSQDLVGKRRLNNIILGTDGAEMGKGAAL